MFVLVFASEGELWFFFPLYDFVLIINLNENETAIVIC